MSATIWVMDFNKSLVVFYLTISPTVIEIAPKLSKMAVHYFVLILLLEPIRH